MLSVLTALRRRLMGARDPLIDSAPILAWRRAVPMPPSAMPLLSIRASLLAGYRVHTLLCHGSSLPVFLLSPTNVHDAPFARPLPECAVRLSQLRPRIIRLDAAYWSLRLTTWIHATLHAVVVVPWNPKQ